ncbi:MAG: transglycosylase domain-containing protein [Actinobacteria bacterium]|nr:transglycosylase domain-containing protein [Actinomycetota bacterium]
MTVLSRLIRFVAVMAALVGVMAASLAMVGPQAAKLVSAHHSDHERISLKPLAERSYIYDSAGRLQGTLTNRDDPQNRKKVTLDEIPETVVESVLAAEDSNFYQHKGVNIRSILRAANANIEGGSVSQGGSTITQQVVKNSLVGDEQDISRKLREAFLAVELEKQMSKDEILEYYLNSVYFGGGAYGVQAASEYYFSKDVGDLDWAEGALLAALIRSPNYYNPFKHPEVAKKRRTIVFKRLLVTGKLTQDEVDFSEFVPLPTTPNRPKPPYDYFVEEVKQQLLADPKYGLGATEAARNRTVFEGGIKVYTTLDNDMQALAIQARNETLPKNNGDATFNVTDPKTGQLTFGTEAMASIQPGTGAVRAMVGGPGFDKWQFNLAIERDPGRQPGSTMKTFVLATLFEKGFVPADYLGGGGSCSFKFPGTTEVSSYTGKAGSITAMTQASSNCGFMRLGQVAGIPDVALMANRVGIRSQLFLTDSDGNPTAPPNNLPLGTMGVSPLDMASAYATFANDGVYNEPYFVERIEDRNGKVLYQHQASPVPAVDPQTARLVTQVLVANVTGGTGRNARIASGQPAAGKTGTTNDSTDVWFVGFTPELSTAIWMGAPKGSISLANAGLQGATGGRYPAATWGRFYSLWYANRARVDFNQAQRTRSGKNIGKVPNQIGGGSSSTSTRRTPTRRTTPASPTPTTPPTTPTTRAPIPLGGG